MNLWMKAGLTVLVGVVYSGVWLEAQDTIQIQDTIQKQDSILLRDSGLSMDSLQAQFSIEGEEELRTADNLDSLLNLWYVNQSLENATDDYDPGADTLWPDFSDATYLARLAEIPAVMDLSYNRIVKNYINVYTRKRREQVRSMLGLSHYYFPMYEAIFDLYGVPYEMKYLSIVESALNPRAVSRAGAVGCWQFMYSTGKHYGLTINSLVDERRDPVAATHAAARYLRDAYKIFGDWTLALAAYNCGPGNVNKAIRRSGGRRTFWEIYYYLPRETRGYVPAFIAATYTMNYHEEHHINAGPAILPAATDTLEVREPLHLKQVAGVLGLPLQQLRDLNPQYRADIIPGTAKRPYALKIPAPQVAAFIDLEDSIYSYKDAIFFDPSKKVASPSSYSASYRADLPADKYDKLYYTVRSGDNVGYIADWYDVRASDLRYWNNISRNLIRVGQKLVIYKPKGKSAPYRGVNNMSHSQKQDFAGRGKTATGSSASYANSSASTSASSSPSAKLPGSDSDYLTYKVRSGDNLWEIAKKYPGVSETDIARLNMLGSGSRIQPGQVLRIKRKG